MQQLKKIVVLGPESTGKSTLCTQLAAWYHTQWVPEYAREYLLTNGKDYTWEDLSLIARGQLSQEDKAVNEKNQPGNLLFIDTDLYVIKVWSEYVFNKCDNFILTAIASRQYDLYLLCNTDLPWVEDELREYPDLYSRQKLFHFYKDAMINQFVPWVEISGNYEQRLINSINFIDKNFA
ncbi:MAG TPA: ATP-binding protein [Ferruginibacter sp.]|nr:ATP-binding protein [Ferruginibacter sp.]